MHLLEAIITGSNDTTSAILAFHDHPYPSLIPCIIKKVKAKHGAPPVIILSEREPVEYIKRRLRRDGGDLMCKNSTSIDRSTLEGGAFDVIGCIDRAVSGLSPEEASNILLADVFTKMKDIFNI